MLVGVFACHNEVRVITVSTGRALLGHLMMRITRMRITIVGMMLGMDGWNGWSGER